MKKLSLLIGALGGAMAGYLFSNQKLRKDLSAAKDAESAARLLGQHLQRDGKKLAQQAQEFIESDEVQKNLHKAREYAQQSFVAARKELMKLVSRAEEGAEDMASDAGVATKRAAKRAVKTAKKAVRKAQMKVRKLL